MSAAARIHLLRLLIRLAISGAAFMLFAIHIASAPRFEILDRIENYLYDARIRMTMPGTVDDRVVIIDIDERSQLGLGQWPWPRSTLAELVDSLFDDYHVRVLGLDVLFAEEGRDDGNEAFAESLIARDVVTGFVFKDFVGDNEPRTTGAVPAPIIRGSAIADVAVPFVRAADGDGFRVGVEQHLVAVEPEAALGGIRPVGAVGVELPRLEARHEGMPVVEGSVQ